MTYDVYRDWILIDGRHYWTDTPRWARIAPGWVAVAPSRLPNAHIGLFPATILDADGPRITQCVPVPIGDGLRLSSPHLWVGAPANELTQQQIETIRYGCVACLHVPAHGSARVDGPGQDFGYAVSSAAA